MPEAARWLGPSRSPGGEPAAWVLKWGGQRRGQQRRALWCLTRVADVPPTHPTRVADFGTLHPPGHSTVHRLAPNAVLAERFNTVECLRAQPELAKFAAFAGRQRETLGAYHRG